MLVGAILTLRGFFYKRFFDWWLFRTLHLCGVIYVGLLAILREYCPLTILEYTLRAEYNPGKQQETTGSDPENGKLLRKRGMYLFYSTIP